MNIDWGILGDVFNDIIEFFDTVFRWLLFVFNVTDTWEPEATE